MSTSKKKYICPKCGNDTLRVEVYACDGSTEVKAFCPCNADGIFAKAIAQTFIGEYNKNFKKEFDDFVKQFKEVAS